jgi:glucosamine--fructose-6-phosphate aminotransferase (isomerizing)
MCGIVGYVGKKLAQNVLVDGLRRLEYRGYDSAGIAVWDKNTERIEIKKREGTVRVLATEVERGTIPGFCGIAHTRWATHGEPSDANSHPHMSADESVAIVHNGTVENHVELRKELEADGVKFVSETDSEVLAHLIARRYEECKDPLLAMRDVLLRIQGTYGLVVLFRAHPDKLYVAKLGSSIVIGVGKDEMIVASDPTAIVPYTQELFYLGEGEMAELSSASYEVRSLDLERLDKPLEHTLLTVEQAQKGEFPHFMLKEIFEQPDAIRNTLRGRLNEADGLVRLGGLDQVSDRLEKIERIVIVACGTAYNAGLVGEYMLESLARIPVEVELASEFRYREMAFDKHTAVIAISQSGETADTLGAVREAKRQGLLTLGIVNTVGSAIARETDVGVYNHAGPEIGVASTKAFITQLVMLMLFTVYLGRQRGMTFVNGVEIIRELGRLPERIREVLARRESYKRIAEQLAEAKNALFIGRRWSCPVAYEGALKLKEISYVHAEGYAAGEMKHGSLALICESFPTVAVVPKDCVLRKTLANISEIRTRGGRVFAVTTDGNEEMSDRVDDVVFVPETIESLTPILTTIPLQLIAYETAVMLGHDPDKPRNLAKSVTVE